MNVHGRAGLAGSCCGTPDSGLTRTVFDHLLDGARDFYTIENFRATALKSVFLITTPSLYYSPTFELRVETTLEAARISLALPPRQREQIALSSLLAYLEPDKGKDNSIVEGLGTLWTSLYKEAEPHSAKLPVLLDRCMQLWAQQRENEDGNHHSGSLHGNPNLRSPLHLCSALGFKRLGEFYLQTGKDPNVLAFPDGQSALHLAAAGGHKEIMGLMLSRGVELEKRTVTTGRTALQIAAFRGHADAVQLLLEEGADMNATDRFGHTALLLATKSGHEEVVDLLLGHSAAKLVLCRNTLQGSENISSRELLPISQNHASFAECGRARDCQGQCAGLGPEHGSCADKPHSCWYLCLDCGHGHRHPEHSDPAKFGGMDDNWVVVDHKACRAAFDDQE